MFKNTLFLLALILLISACNKDDDSDENVENKEVNWTLLEGTMSYHSGGALQLTPDNGVIVAGNLNSNYEVYKTNLNFQIDWNINKGAQAFEEANAVAIADNNRYLIAGNSVFGLQAQMYVISLDADGSVIWSHNYGWSDINVCYDICRSIDPNAYVMCGHVQDTKRRDAFGDIHALKINNDGDTIWYKIYPDIGEETAYAITATNDGGFVMTGRDENNNNKDLALVKINASGDLQWFRFFGGNTWEEGFYVIEDSQGNIVVCGIAQGATADVYIVKTNAAGELIWEKMYGETDKSEKGLCIQETQGGYVISGSQYIVENIDDDIYLFKIDGDGNQLWKKVYGGSNSDYGNSVKVLLDGKLILAGTTKTASVDGNIYLLKTDANGVN